MSAIKSEIKPKVKSNPVVTTDGLENLIANLGTSLDKRAATRVKQNRVLSNENHAELDALYRTDWIAGKVVDIVPEDMTREWRTWTGDISPEQIKTLEAAEDSLSLRAKFCEAHKWARLYGTAFIVISADDGQEVSKPLKLNKIKPGSLKFIHAIDRHRLTTANVVPVADPLSVYFGMPELYRFNETSTQIHASRLLRFDGVKLPYEELRINNYFSDSVLSRMYEAIINFGIATESSASMIFETNVDVMSIPQLWDKLNHPTDESLLLKRMSMVGYNKSMNNMVMIGTDEKIEKHTNTFAGLPALIDRFGLHLSAASDIPATRLMGSSATGFNATGEGDLKNYYDMLRAKQQSDYKPLLDYFDQVMCASLGLQDIDKSYEFVSLFQMSSKDQASIDLDNANRDAIYVGMGALNAKAVALELQQKRTYTNLKISENNL